MRQLHQRYDAEYKFGFILCSEKAPSYFFVGDKDLGPIKYSVQLKTDGFYEVPTSGFYDENKKKIAGNTGDYSQAIFDTGTGGFVLLNNSNYNALINHIKSKYTGHDKFSANFWKKNYCDPIKKFQFNKLPTIRIGFKKYKQEGDYYLKLPPQSYITDVGCPNGYGRLIFTPTLPDFHPSAKRNSGTRRLYSKFPAMVVGTAILNQYAAKLHLRNGQRIEFYPNKNLCKPLKK